MMILRADLCNGICVVDSSMVFKGYNSIFIIYSRGHGKGPWEMVALTSEGTFGWLYKSLNKSLNKSLG